MAELIEFRQQLDIVNERVVAFERSLADHPGYPSIAANLESARRIQRKLEAQFVEASAGESRAAEQCNPVADATK